MLQLLTTNPTTVFFIVIGIIVLLKLLKLSGKIIKWALIIGGIYWALVYFGLI